MTKRRKTNQWEQTRVARLRIDGIVSGLKRSGPCTGCHQICELFEAQTNQGLLHLCKACLEKGKSQAKRSAPTSAEAAHRERTQADAMAHRRAGSFESGKKK